LWNKGFTGAVVAAFASLALLGCGTEPADRSSAAVITEPTSPVRQGPPTKPPPVPPSTVITAGTDSLVALEIPSGEVVVLADRRELAASLLISDGRFDDVDLSPDGSTVAFIFGGFDGGRGAHGLYEVPVDGSSAPVRISLDGDGGYLARPRYSPDGRLLAVYSGDRLRVLTEERALAGDGIQMAYPPHHLTWTPGGDGLVWLWHAERTGCCTSGTASIDPPTGRITSGPDNDSIDGSPYFDHSGRLRTVPLHFTFDVDATGRFTVATDGTSQQILWWDDTSDDPPRRLPVALELQEVPPVAW
jgi:hypothetical protein